MPSWEFPASRMTAFRRRWESGEPSAAGVGDCWSRVVLLMRRMQGLFGRERNVTYRMPLARGGIRHHDGLLDRLRNAVVGQAPDGQERGGRSAIPDPIR